MDTKTVLRVLTIYRAVASQGFSVVVNGGEFWIGPEQERLKKIVDANEEPEMLSGPFESLDLLESWLDGYLAGIESKNPKPNHVEIKPASVKQGAH